MKSTGKKMVAIFIATIMMLMMVPLMGTQKAYASGIDYSKYIDYGTSGSCDWFYYKDDSGKYILGISAGSDSNGKMADYKLESGESTAPWTKYRKQADEVVFDGVTEIGDYAFYEFTKISKVDVQGVKRIGDHAFYACRELEFIHVEGDNCVIQEEAFNECFSFENNIVMDVVALEGVKTLEYEAFGEVDCKNLNLGEGLESIGPGCFYCNETVRFVSIPSSCTYIAQNAFSGCEKMEVALIRNPSCTIEEYAFDKSYVKGLYVRNDSTALAYAKQYGFNYKIFGDMGSGELDLTDGAVTLKEENIEDLSIATSIEILAADGQFNGTKNLNDINYIDIDKDGTQDVMIDNNDVHAIQIEALEDRSVGGVMTFTISQDRIVQGNGGFIPNPFYSTLTIRLQKAKNPMTVSAKTATVKYSKLKKKNQILTRIISK